jgi:hypothetical protein
MATVCALRYFCVRVLPVLSLSRICFPTPQLRSIYAQLGKARRLIANKFDVAAVGEHRCEILKINALMTKLATRFSMLHICKHSETL